MPISIFEMFRVGIGPSSSHTVGPMRAAGLFVRELQRRQLLAKVARITVDLMGSLGATGRGHATDVASMLGLMGHDPATVDTAYVGDMIQCVHSTHRLQLPQGQEIEFDPARDIIFSPQNIALFHTNAMNLRAYGDDGQPIYWRRYYSVGGGFVVTADESNPEHVTAPDSYLKKTNEVVPNSYRNARELVAMAKDKGCSIADIVRENEHRSRTDAQVNSDLDHIWNVMHECIERGLHTTGVMPGGMHVPRRAAGFAKNIGTRTVSEDPLVALDWVNAWAFAVGEENACGGRVVTSPTNGAAAVIPAVINYYVNFVKGANAEGVRTFLLTAGAIGMLYKENASISGAEVGCQGEVGVACSMAAAGLAAVLGASVDQVENAAEIGMEHHLGMTCDPISGQVQIPCIERNAVAAVKAITAARIAMAGDGVHIVSLDQVMRTMFETGRDMQAKYKETSQGGLAVSIVEC